MEAKIRIECIVRSSTRALRDRRLNSLYRRIIANENIGCAGITNGRGADEMHDRATFRPISSTKNILWTGFLLRFKICLCYRQYEQSTIYLHVIVSPLRQNIILPAGRIETSSNLTVLRPTASVFPISVNFIIDLISFGNTE